MALRLSCDCLNTSETIPHNMYINIYVCGCVYEYVYVCICVCICFCICTYTQHAPSINVTYVTRLRRYIQSIAGLYVVGIVMLLVGCVVV